jgi:hypothetical protein
MSEFQDYKLASFKALYKSTFTFTLHLSHLADALIQSDLQIGAFTL